MNLASKALRIQTAGLKRNRQRSHCSRGSAVNNQLGNSLRRNRLRRSSAALSRTVYYPVGIDEGNSERSSDRSQTLRYILTRVKSRVARMCVSVRRIRMVGLKGMSRLACVRYLTQGRALNESATILGKKCAEYITSKSRLVPRLGLLIAVFSLSYEKCFENTFFFFLGRMNMKRVLPALLLTGLAATWVGCQKADDPSATVTPAEKNSASGAEVTLVTLSVPNMV